MIKKARKKGSGGFREGAGRPKKENARNKTVSFVCTETEARMINEAAGALGISKSEYICNLLFKTY